jgi:putative nucleotidyltransferase with HDIG domain
MAFKLIALTQTAVLLPRPRTEPRRYLAPSATAARPLDAPAAGPARGVLPRGGADLDVVACGNGTAAYAGIRLTDVVSALSCALDMAEGQPVGHSVRTAMIGMRIGSHLGLSDDDHSALFYALLLKDLGSSSNAARMSSLFRADDRALKQAYRLIDWTNPLDAAGYAFRNLRPGTSWLVRGWHAVMLSRRMKAAVREMALIRGERGADIAGTLVMPQATSDAIAAIEEHWDGNGLPHGLRGSAIPMLARIVCLAQLVEVFENTFDVDAAYDMAHTRRGRWFDPMLVDCLDAFRGDIQFWAELRHADALWALRTYEPPTRVVFANELRLDTIAEAFSHVVDAKSPFTARHSENVSFLATRTATELGMSATEIRAIRRAGLLHDVGKLGVSSRVLTKPTALDAAETKALQQHTTYTLEILRRVPRFERFAFMAAAHHERLDGGGYHMGLRGDALSLSMRILAAADVCEALSADRPYRRGMPIDAALRAMESSVKAGHLCPVAVEALTGWFRGLPATQTRPAPAGDSTSLIGI